MPIRRPSSQLVFKNGPVDPGLDLTGWWPFFDGTATDWSGFQNNGTLTGAPSVVDTALYGKAVALNGSTQYIDVGGAATIAQTVSTYCAWVFPTSYPGNGGVILGSSGVSGGPEWRINSSDSKASLIRQNAALLATSTSTVSLSVLTHLAVTVDGSNVIKCYKNGIADGGATVAPGYSFTNLQIGHAGNADFFAGQLGDVRIYRRALAPAEINSIYNQGIAGLSLAPDEWEMPIMQAAAAGGGFPWWAVQNNIPVIGAGTY